jgi:hypothetical protein
MEILLFIFLYYWIKGTLVCWAHDTDDFRRDR